MLPQPTTESEALALDRGSAFFVSALRQGFPQQTRSLPMHPTASGSRPVFWVGDHYVAKLFSPLDTAAYENEVAVLRRLECHPDVFGPELIATREIEGWSAVLMTRVKGRSLKEIWPGLGSEQKEALCASLGNRVRALHTLAPGEPSLSGVDWTRFVEEQCRTCVQRQLQLGLKHELAEQIPDFLASQELGQGDALVLLHTEIMLEHVFAEKSGNDYRLGALVDFEPAMFGAAEYEFASLGLFVAGGDSRFLRALLRGYGYDFGPEFHRRVMAYTLLHRYSKMSWYLQFMPPGAQGEDLEALAQSWFGKCS